MSTKSPIGTARTECANDEIAEKVAKKETTCYVYDGESGGRGG